MTLTVYNAYFESSQPHKVAELLEIKNPAKRFNQWAAEYISFYDLINKRFPIGFLPYVYEKLEKKPEIKWERSPELYPVFSHPLLRLEQKRVASAILANKFLKYPFQVGVPNMVTGSGKSYVISHLIGLYHPYRILLLVANKEPHKVALDRLKRDWGHQDIRRKGKPVFPKEDTFMKIGSYAGATWQAGSYCTVAMMQTIVARLKPISHKSRSSAYGTARNYKHKLQQDLREWKRLSVELSNTTELKKRNELLRKSRKCNITNNNYEDRPTVIEEKEGRFYVYSKHGHELIKPTGKSIDKNCPQYQKILTELQKYQVIIYDECDTITNAFWMNFLMDLPAVVRLGFTATLNAPLLKQKVTDEDRIKHWRNLSLFGHEIKEANIGFNEQWDKGRLQIPKFKIYRVGKPFSAPPEWFIEVNSLMKKKLKLQRKGKSFQHIEGQLKEARREIAKKTTEGQYAALITCKERMEIAAKECRKSDNKFVLLSVERVEQGESLQEYFESQGISCEYINSDTNPTYQESVIERFNNGELVLIAGKGMSRGANIKLIRKFIRMHGRDDMTNVVQFFGRPIRTDGINKFVEVIDFYDRYGEASKPSKDRTLKASENRVFWYRGLQSEYEEKGNGGIEIEFI